MDNDIIKIPTFKSGNFIISKKYKESEISGLLYGINILYKTVADLPILPDWASQLEVELVKRSIFGTAAIEGNPLNEEEVGKIISGPDKKDDIAKKAEQEIKNLKEVYDFIKTIVPSESPVDLTEQEIAKIHFMMTKNVSYELNEPGKYRNQKVQVGDKDHGGVYTPPKCLPDIKKLMEEFTIWINTENFKRQDPVVRAALAHYHLGLIHPFGNGNGRTARAIEGILLRSANIKYVPTMLSNYYYKKLDDYFWAFSLSRKNNDHDVTPFIKFVLDGVIDSLNEIKDRMIFYLRSLVIRDYSAFLKKNKVITQRQHDLITLMLEDHKSFTLNDLMNNPPFNLLYRDVSERTARRDIKKLLELELLDDQGGRYALNIQTIG
ncbi:MAG: Fic family protein [Syntrophales bacterium]|nr:Fic family protein [Syntrophales bacterium]MDD4997813.1 Fic family protein [Syntrophales bacterium]HPL64169.1 Fic family protein [Syntrophales bacterium]